MIIMLPNVWIKFQYRLMSFFANKQPVTKITNVCQFINTLRSTLYRPSNNNKPTYLIDGST